MGAGVAGRRAVVVTGRRVRAAGAAGEATGTSSANAQARRNATARRCLPSAVLQRMGEARRKGGGFPQVQSSIVSLLSRASESGVGQKVRCRQDDTAGQFAEPGQR